MSRTLVKRNASEIAIISYICLSEILPRNSTLLETPNVSHSDWQDARQGPSPATTSLAFEDGAKLAMA